MNRILHTILLGALLLVGVTNPLHAQEDGNSKHQIAVRYIAPNFISLLDNRPSNVLGSESFGAGLEFEYQYRFAPNFLLGVPISISSSEAILDNTVTLDGSPINLNRDLTSIAATSIAALLVFEPIAKPSFFDPQIYGGFGVFSDDWTDNTMELPVGVNLNFRLGGSAYVSPSISYRLGLDADDEGIRDNLRLGVGLHFQLGVPAGPPPPPPVVDTDGDGIEDSADRCPTEAGPSSTLGCPDTDGDGIADIDDKCPEVAGVSEFMGCPDTDGDGLADPDDECPEEAGPVDNNGCPIPDRDGDGTPDAEDECPDVAGTLALMGCPDGDGDGIADKDDDCPTEAGPAANNGCPDTDGDGVLDKDDSCPTEVGPASNKGCPEITEEDQEVIEFAIQNINFETASARLTADSRDVLARVMDILKRYPGYQLAIGGHTDSIGSAESNQGLSERRAKSVYDYLVENGINARKLSYKGFGETMPIADNRYRDGRELNRRVTLDFFIE